jgi:hypothetical protein
MGEMHNLPLPFAKAVMGGFCIVGHNHTRSSDISNGSKTKMMNLGALPW